MFSIGIMSLTFSETNCSCLGSEMLLPITSHYVFRFKLGFFAPYKCESFSICTFKSEVRPIVMNVKLQFVQIHSAKIQMNAIKMHELL